MYSTVQIEQANYKMNLTSFRDNLRKLFPDQINARILHSFEEKAWRLREHEPLINSELREGVIRRAKETPRSDDILIPRAAWWMGGSREERENEAKIPSTWRTWSSTYSGALSDVKHAGCAPRFFRGESPQAHIAFITHPRPLPASGPRERIHHIVTL